MPILTGKGKGVVWQFVENKWLLGNINGPLEEKVKQKIVCEKVCWCGVNL